MRSSIGGDYGAAPQFIRRGVMYRERDYVGDARMLALEPNERERALKGDLGSTTIPNLESHYSFEGGVNAPPPFANMRTGR